MEADTTFYEACAKFSHSPLDASITLTWPSQIWHWKWKWTSRTWQWQTTTTTRRRSDDFAWPGGSVWAPTEVMAVMVLSNEGHLKPSYFFFLEEVSVNPWIESAGRTDSSRILLLPIWRMRSPWSSLLRIFTIMSPSTRGLRLTSTFRVSQGRSPTNIKVSLKAAILYEKHPIKARNCFLWNLGIDLLNNLSFLFI